MALSVFNPITESAETTSSSNCLAGCSGARGESEDARSSARVCDPTPSAAAVFEDGVVVAGAALEGHVWASGGGAAGVVGVLLPAFAARDGVRADAELSLRFAEAAGTARAAGAETVGAGFTAMSPTIASVSCTGR